MRIVEEEFYTRPHQSYTAYIATEDCANACTFHEYSEGGEYCDSSYTVRFCKKCSDIISKDTDVASESKMHKGEMELSGIRKLGYFADGSWECVHLI